MESNMKKGAATSSYDAGTNNDIQITYNTCGCVMQLDLDAAYDATTMSTMVCGKMMPKDAEGNTCELNMIASPDNVAMIPEFNQLIIGEDTSAHQNDVMWIYDIATKALTRIFSTPYGSETTSPYWFPNVGGKFSYITAVVQHPYGESDTDKVTEAKATGLAGYVGYLGPFKTVVEMPGNGAAGTTASIVLSLVVSCLAAVFVSF
ncbi:hypothetical protein T484DRAFT_1901167 [Baffinella frigidus]|nr:hypothetical protein T484DRAFT_1901167 [Cryptophyta sp. CCMP2293]